MFRRWGQVASSSWNISGELCSGIAIDSSNITDYNPAIKCDCSFIGGTVCHVTQLRVHSLDVIGTFPEELSYLTYLRDLNLAQNYLTGPLPAFVGNLSSLTQMKIGYNALSGPIPKELGNLKKLIYLGFGSNNFSGTIPPELAGLSSLQQWYISSSGLSGELPNSLSKLTTLQILWASDCNFTGKIPDFIGTWTNLNVLKIQGNSFNGPIPSSFSNLFKLTDLRIGDILNGSSSLAFIRNMTSLRTLILRNAKISDTLPSNFTKYTSLTILDLSFNNITGNIPQSLLNLKSLNLLYLGNNSMTGTLPGTKSPALSTIDLSYNQLSGSFPFWVNIPNLEINLVANNFVIDNSNLSVLPSGLECLQRDTPCYRGSPIYSQFGIRCGGGASVTSSDGTKYDMDNANLSTASYYVTNPRKWAVSSTGSFLDATNANTKYIISSTSQFQNTTDIELYQTSRMSPSSLRYYGLGLENGNYTIKLHFVEMGILDPPTWKSLGRRVFNIYMQGILKEKDFDIRKEAGGKSFTAVVREYQAPVINNFLEIHFFWAGKGTSFIPFQSYYGPSISAISVAPFGFIPSVSNKATNSSSTSNNTILIVGIVVGVLAVLGFVIFAMLLWRHKKNNLSEDDKELLGMTIRPNIYSYAELKVATEDFNQSNLLGEGGFGVVYKGKLCDGRMVAVKQLLVASQQGRIQFMAEIATISAVQHRNLVKLYGCCIEGDKRLLVYEYLENKSLDKAIFSKNGLNLDWKTRFEICLGAARGLAYLHEESSVRIVHRDIKSSNILLDNNLNPKISDFGLAKLYDDKKTHISTRVAGTIGYLAPEYAMRGHLTEKADVFGFGVVALEILSGRPNFDHTLEEEKVYLLDWAWCLYEQKYELNLVDPTLSSYNRDEATRVIGVALLCIQTSPLLRPSMSRVVAMLVGDIEINEVTSRPSYLTEWQFNDLSNNFVNDDFSRSTGTMLTSSEDIVPSDPNIMINMGNSSAMEVPLRHNSVGGRR